MPKKFKLLHIVIFFVACAYAGLIVYATRVTALLQANQFAKTEVLYSHQEQIPPHIISLIRTSQNYVYLAMYTLTHEDLVDALIAAKLRGLDVRVLLDFSQSTIEQEKPQISKMKKYNIDVKIPFREDGIMHTKMLLTDSGYASGSFNWTISAANYNDEVLEIGQVRAIHDQYMQVWNQLWQEK